MSIQKLVCLNCAAPLPLPEDADGVTCQHCETSFLIRRHEEGSVSLKTLQAEVEGIARSAASIETHTEGSAVSGNVVALKVQREALKAENADLEFRIQDINKIESEAQTPHSCGVGCIVFAILIVIWIKQDVEDPPMTTWAIVIALACIGFELSRYHSEKSRRRREGHDSEREDLNARIERNNELIENANKKIKSSNLL